MLAMLAAAIVTLQVPSRVKSVMKTGGFLVAAGSSMIDYAWLLESQIFSANTNDEKILVGNQLWLAGISIVLRLGLLGITTSHP